MDDYILLDICNPCTVPGSLENKIFLGVVLAFRDCRSYCYPGNPILSRQVCNFLRPAQFKILLAFAGQLLFP
jgi:hypothetical protein